MNASIAYRCMVNTSNITFLDEKRIRQKRNVHAAHTQIHIHATHMMRANVFQSHWIMQALQGRRYKKRGTTIFCICFYAPHTHTHIHNPTATLVLFLCARSHAEYCMALHIPHLYACFMHQPSVQCYRKMLTHMLVDNGGDGSVSFYHSTMYAYMHHIYIVNRPLK